MFGRFVACKGFFLCTILTFWTTETLGYAIRGGWKLVISGTHKVGAT